MEKIIYAAWRPAGTDQKAFHEDLLGVTADKLLCIPGLRGLRLNLPDDDVSRAAPLRVITTNPAPDAVVQVWLDVGHGEFRSPVDSALKQCSSALAAWLATESTVIINRKHPPEPWARTEGWSQVCFLQRPERLTHEQWLSTWQGSHTRVAIETQANFEYIQNLIVRQLLGAPLPYAAMVEECFPMDAMDHPEVFFDAAGDPERFRRNTTAMANSCARFIDFDRIEVIPTSQYVMAAVN